MSLCMGSTYVAFVRIKSSSTKHGVVLGSLCSILCGQYCTWYGIQNFPEILTPALFVRPAEIEILLGAALRTTYGAIRNSRFSTV